MSDTWREILIDVEPRGKEFRLGVDRDATVSDIMKVVQDRCRDEGVELDKWARTHVGADFQFVLLRKAEGNAVLAPGMTLGEVDPEIQENEKFKLGAQPVVGALPFAVFNRRIEVLIDDFYAGSLAPLYEREGWEWRAPERAESTWEQELVSVRVAARHRDRAFRTLEVRLTGIPGIQRLGDGGVPEIGWEHRFDLELPRQYPADLKIDIRTRTPLFHPRFRADGKTACYNVNGEVDRILVDLVYNTLLRPDLVRPPSLYPGQDWGVNWASMKWYIEAGPQRVFEGLEAQLRARRAAREAPRVAVLPARPPAANRVRVRDE